MKVITQGTLLPPEERKYLTQVVVVKTDDGEARLEYDPTVVYGTEKSTGEGILEWKEQFEDLPFIIKTDETVLCVTEDNLVFIRFSAYNPHR